MKEIAIGVVIIVAIIVATIVATVVGYGLVRAYLALRHGTRAGLSMPSTRP